MSQAAENELLIAMFGDPVSEVSGDALDEMAGHYYEPPEGFVKPTNYPGLAGVEHDTAIGKGYVDLGLIDPQEKGLAKNAKLRASILRHVVKLLIAAKGKSAFIRDPEWVLKQVYTGQMVKTVLKEKIEEALEAMFDMPVSVTISGFKGKTGFGWRFKAPALAKHPKVAA